MYIFLLNRHRFLPPFDMCQKESHFLRKAEVPPEHVKKPIYLKDIMNTTDPAQRMFQFHRVTSVQRPSCRPSLLSFNSLEEAMRQPWGSGLQCFCWLVRLHRRRVHRQTESKRILKALLIQN